MEIKSRQEVIDAVKSYGIPAILRRDRNYQAFQAEAQRAMKFIYTVRDTVSWEQFRHDAPCNPPDLRLVLPGMGDVLGKRRRLADKITEEWLDVLKDVESRLNAGLDRLCEQLEASLQEDCSVKLCYFPQVIAQYEASLRERSVFTDSKVELDSARDSIKDFIYDLGGIGYTMHWTAVYKLYTWLVGLIADESCSEKFLESWSVRLSGRNEGVKEYSVEQFVNLCEGTVLENVIEELEAQGEEYEGLDDEAAKELIIAKYSSKCEDDRVVETYTFACKDVVTDILFFQNAELKDLDGQYKHYSHLPLVVKVGVQFVHDGLIAKWHAELERNVEVTESEVGEFCSFL